MSGRTVLCYHPRYDGRGFSPVQRSWGRYRTAWDLFARLGLLGGAGAPVRHVCQRPAAPEQLLPVHPPEYVEHVRRRDAEGRGSLDGRETPAWRGVFERALIAVGGSLEGADLIGSGAATHVFNPGGGLHHARRAATAGFCIFNDVALAVHRLRADYGLARVAVVDVDGHHGDGTQELLYDQPVLTLSLHQYDGRFFPGTGSVDEVGWGHGFGYSVNAGLPRHTGDDGYLAAFGAIVPAALRRYRPAGDPAQLRSGRALRRPPGAPVALDRQLPRRGGRGARAGPRAVRRAPAGLRQRGLPPPARRPLLGDDGGHAGGRPPGGAGSLAGALRRSPG